MKYTVDDLSALWGKDYFVYDHCEDNERFDIFLKSKPHSCKCPVCGYESRHLHSTYVRILQDVPFRCKATYVHANVYKYRCENPQCNVRVFTEQLPFAHGHQVRTDALNTLILAVSMFLSDEGASQVLSQMGIAVSNDSIRRIYERIKFADEPDIEAIGIDDVALRKGRTYATAIYDLNDHHMIALLEGKLGETVKEWLKSHKKIKLAARDRTNAYGGPISDILPECVQVADRFHLLNNLLKYLKDIFNSQMPQNIFIHDGEVLERAPKKIPTEDIIDTPNLNYDNSVPVDENGREIVFESRMNNPSSTAYKQQVAKRKKTAINYSSPSNGEN